MKSFYADLHIHIGADTRGRVVKVTASPDLNIANLIREARERKGLDIVGIVDCASPGVLQDLHDLLDRGILFEQDRGGLVYQGDTVIFTGSEVELQGPLGPGHFLAYFPYLEQLEEYSRRMAEHISNIQLSSQKAYLEPGKWFALVSVIGGRVIPAHAFTPHKSLYGSMAHSIEEIAGPQMIAGLELGLSADCYLASMIEETCSWTYLSNSDAHSTAKIGREYNLLQMEEANFEEFEMALAGKGGRKVAANYGLDPRLGKYHRTFCLDCNLINRQEPPVLSCSNCGSENVVKGVLDRVVQLAGGSSSKESYQELRRGTAAGKPPYHYQIPLEMVPGIGKKTLDRLISAFGSEMAVIHNTSLDDLKEVVASSLAEKIILAREGKLTIKAGGGGHYGRVNQ